MIKYLITTLLCWVLCQNVFSQALQLINPAGQTAESRINPPLGYQRESLPQNSFGAYLRNFPLEANGAKVYYYNGEQKTGNVYVAVLKIDVGKRDLQQCADAIMRLRAEYLFGQERYDDIHFNFTNGFRADYRQWADGSRIRVNGNKVSWENFSKPDYSYPVFRAYLNYVFMYAGTLSLSQELTSTPYSELQTGDVLIQGGTPGHAVIVMDVAVNARGEKVYLLAQSYMPAQSIHILKNPTNPTLSPWYELSSKPVIKTPEWTFTSRNLKRFK